MECPVCGNNKISPFATHCLECGTDIVAFHLLDDLEEQCVTTLKDNVALEGELTALEQLRRDEKRRARKKLNRMWWFILLLPLLFLWFGRKEIPVTDDTALKALEEKNIELQAKVAKLEEKLKKPIPKQVTHVVKKGENLSKLAKLYLGNGSKWDVLHRLNPEIKNARLLIPGDTIIIKLKEEK